MWSSPKSTIRHYCTTDFDVTIGQESSMRHSQYAPFSSEFRHNTLPNGEVKVYLLPLQLYVLSHCPRTMPDGAIRNSAVLSTAPPSTCNASVGASFHRDTICVDRNRCRSGVCKGRVQPSGTADVCKPWKVVERCRHYTRHSGVTDSNPAQDSDRLHPALSL